MNICILSMQQINNYGSLLQAYSLKKMIESLGHSVYFIDILPNSEDNQIRNTVMEYEEGQKKAPQSLISRILFQDKNLYFAVKKSVNKKMVQKKQLIFKQNILKLDQADNDRKYDVCVIGSDEVFNCMNNSSWGFTTQLFGNVSQAPKVITYAASCGFTTSDMLSDQVKDAIRGAFQKISAFSVRDENTNRFVQELNGTCPIINLDPVAVGNFDDELAKVNVYNRLPKKCCIIYAYHDRINSHDEIQAIIRFCKEHNLTPVTIGGYQRWVHNHLVLSPFEVLAAFKQADFVFTDTFHGALFSAKYAKRFAVIVRDSNRNKLADLINRFGIERHVLHNIEEIGEVYRISPDRIAIDRMIEAERKKTLLYLENNL